VTHTDDIDLAYLEDRRASKRADADGHGNRERYREKSADLVAPPALQPLALAIQTLGLRDAVADARLPQFTARAPVVLEPRDAERVAVRRIRAVAPRRRAPAAAEGTLTPS
jgi:hypothetical protein